MQFSYLKKFFNGWRFLTENRFAKHDVGVNFANIVEKFDFDQKQKSRKKRSKQKAGRKRLIKKYKKKGKKTKKIRKIQKKICIFIFF